MLRATAQRKGRPRKVRRRQLPVQRDSCVYSEELAGIDQRCWNINRNEHSHDHLMKTIAVRTEDRTIMEHLPDAGRSRRVHCQRQAAEDSGAFSQRSPAGRGFEPMIVRTTTPCRSGRRRLTMQKAFYEPWVIKCRPGDDARCGGGTALVDRMV